VREADYILTRFVAEDKYLYAPPFDPFHQAETFDTIAAVLFLDHACPDSADILMMVSSE
jgi:hypothetical protein